MSENSINAMARQFIKIMKESELLMGECIAACCVALASATKNGGANIDGVCDTVRRIYDSYLDEDKK